MKECYGCEGGNDEKELCYECLILSLIEEEYKAWRARCFDDVGFTRRLVESK